MLTWCFFVLFVFGENRQPALEENQFKFCLDCVAPCLEESLLSLAKLRLEEERPSLFQIQEIAFHFSILLQRLLRYLVQQNGMKLSLWGLLNF